MKFSAFLLSFLVATTVGLAQASKAPAAKPATGKAAPQAKEEKMGVIEGTTLTRPNGHFLGLKLEGGKYKLTFYDEKKKPEKIDVSRGTARWPNIHGSGDNRTVLNPAGDGTYLLGGQFVRGPYAFKLFITLLRGDGDEAAAVENYTIDFRG